MKPRNTDHIDWNAHYIYCPKSPSGLMTKPDKYSRPLAERIALEDFAGSVHGERYYTISFQGKNYMCHRIVWEIKKGRIPSDLIIDHKDGNKLNNKIRNLRLAY